MFVFFGIVIILATLYIRFRYRPQGSTALQMFLANLFSGVITLFTTNSMGSFVMVLLLVLQLVMCAGLLGLYRLEVERQREAKRRRAVSRRIAQRQAENDAKLRARAAFMAMAADAA